MQNSGRFALREREVVFDHRHCESLIPALETVEEDREVAADRARWRLFSAHQGDGWRPSPPKARTGAGLQRGPSASRPCGT